MSSASTPTSSASVQNILTLLVSRDAHLVAGASGLERRVTWSCRMRVRLPAFESVQGGELALLTLAQLRRLDETLPHLLKSLAQEGFAAVAVAAASVESLGIAACSAANQLQLPLILLPPAAPLEEIEREVITFVISFRGEIDRKAAAVSHELMQLSIQGAGMQGVCEHLAQSCNKWVIVENAEHHVRFQVGPTSNHALALPFPTTVSDERLKQQGFTRVTAAILIRHEVVGYLSLVGNDGDFDYLDRMILGQVAPILALEFARERERSEVESRYQVEAFMDVLQGNYQQAEEMLARARLLGYELTTPHVVVIFEIIPAEPEHPVGSAQAQWSKRVRDELLRVWPTCWVSTESRRVIALLPLSKTENSLESENTIVTRLERVQARLQQGRANSAGLPAYSGGIGRIANDLPAIPQSWREAQQALEISRRLFGDERLHSFANLGIYRLLFYLAGQSELTEFYLETLGPLLNADTRGDGALIETLEGFFRCNGNLSETARAMHLHRNSLLYRLGRIEEILGSSLDNPELRLSLQIALKIHHLQKR